MWFTCCVVLICFFLHVWCSGGLLVGVVGVLWCYIMMCSCVVGKFFIHVVLLLLGGVPVVANRVCCTVA